MFMLKPQVLNSSYILYHFMDVREKIKQRVKENKNNKNIIKKELDLTNSVIKHISHKNKLQFCKDYAIEKDGKCLSEEYKTSWTRITWQCKEGHVWKSTPHHILNRNQWCPRCGAIQANKYRKLDWKEIKKLARNKKGRLLSKESEYINTDSKLLWECQVGHKWEASISSIKHQGSWCPQCATNYKEELTRYIFETFTGLKFPNSRPKWLINPSSNRALELDGYNEKNKIAFEYNGVQHYEHNNFFHGKKTSLEKQKSYDELKRFLCDDKGIKLCIIKKINDEKELTEFIKQWLHKNNIKIISDVDLNKKPSFKFTKHEKFKKFVESLGYELLDNYVGIDKKVNIRCSNGHIWNVQPRAVKNGNRCQFCSRKFKYDLDFIKKESNKLDLLCLAKEYINNSVWMPFKCKKCGSEITRTSTHIMNGRGCDCGN